MRAHFLLLLATLLACPAAAQSGPQNCDDSEAHRAFDFWIGSWEVSLPDGSVAGTNRIKKLAGSCALQEHWVGAGGSEGKSFNYVDARTGAWKQLWVDGAGGHMTYEGAFSDGAMRFEGTNVYGNGQVTLMRMTFTPGEEGSVRQFIEESRDEGETWATWFDGTYRRTGEDADSE